MPTSVKASPIGVRLKVKLAREPRRLVVLSAKLLAMMLLVAPAVVVAFMLMLATGTIVAGTRGLDVSAWWTSAGLGGMLVALLRLVASVLVWGFFGFALGVLLRSSAAAIGVGLGGLLLGGHLGERIFTTPGKWLPDQILSAFVVGGTTSATLAFASLSILAYTILLATASAVTFSRGDVPG